MTSTANHDLFNQVADFLFKHRYHEKSSQKKPLSNHIQFSSPHNSSTRMTVQAIIPPEIIITMIHDICPISTIEDRGKLHKEIGSFNALMESALLPVFLWTDTSREILELHWQESFSGPGDLLLLQNMCNQAEYLSFSVCKRVKALHGANHAHPQTLSPLTLAGPAFKH